MKILSIEAMQILDSRGNPTVQVRVFLDDGSFGEFRVPSGASTGIHEAHELRDKNKNVYHGKSVLKVVENIDEIKLELYNKDFTQESLDEKLIELDGTENKGRIGANGILGVSIAFAKASAKYYNLSLYEYLYRLINNVSFSKRESMKLPDLHLFANVINGGLHAGNSLNIQEFMIIPTFGTVQDKVRAISEIYHNLKDLIRQRYGSSQTSVGDEGGFAPDILTTREALDLLVESIRVSNYEGLVSLAMDAAASDFFDKVKGKYEPEEGLFLDYRELTKYYQDLINSYPIISIEDAMSEDDFEGFSYYLKTIKKMKSCNPLTELRDVLSVGDDLLVTNPSRIKIAQTRKLCNSLLLKINQIGTLSEAVEAHNMAQSSRWHTIVSHRSGETSDDFISDLAVAMGSSIKLGAPARGERVAKYNRLLNIYN